MSTVSESISTLISNVQSAAAEMVTAVNAASAGLLDSIPALNKAEVPTVAQLPSKTFEEPTALYDMLATTKQSLADIGGDLPSLQSILNTTESTALDTFEAYLLEQRAVLVARAAAINVQLSRLFPMAGFVKVEAEKINSILTTNLEVPDFARDAFTSVVQLRAGEMANLAYWRTKGSELILQSNVDTVVDMLNAKRSLVETQSLLELVGVALSGAVGIIRKTIVTPEDLLRLFEQLSSARTKVATGVAANQVAQVGSKMEYINAVLGYYDMFGDLEKVRVDGEVLRSSIDADTNNLKATFLAGIASSAASIAAAGYSAARVGVVLSDKAFS